MFWDFLYDKFKDEKEYYVNMLNAWLVCELFIKRREKTIEFLTNNNLNKFINYMILLGTFVGMTLYIIQGTLNYVIYATILLTLISSLMDMFCKKP